MSHAFLAGSCVLSPVRCSSQAWSHTVNIGSLDMSINHLRPRHFMLAVNWEHRSGERPSEGCTCGSCEFSGDSPILNAAISSSVADMPPLAKAFSRLEDQRSLAVLCLLDKTCAIGAIPALNGIFLRCIAALSVFYAALHGPDCKSA